MTFWKPLNVVFPNCLIIAASDGFKFLFYECGTSLVTLFLLQIPDVDLSDRKSGMRVDSLTGDTYLKNVWDPPPKVDPVITPGVSEEEEEEEEMEGEEEEEMVRRLT